MDVENLDDCRPCLRLDQDRRYHLENPVRWDPLEKWLALDPLPARGRAGLANRDEHVGFEMSPRADDRAARFGDTPARLAARRFMVTLDGWSR